MNVSYTHVNQNHGEVAQLNFELVDNRPIPSHELDVSEGGQQFIVAHLQGRDSDSLEKRNAPSKRNTLQPTE